MRAVGHWNTALEMKLRRVLWRAGVRYRTHRRTAGTKPDIVFVGQRVAVFVDGCWWHGCPEHYTAPVHNAAFWRKKLEGNKARDLRDSQALREAGWRVLRFWGCEVNKRVDAVAKTIVRAVRRSGAPRASPGRRSYVAFT
jgi:DNA mismatch endonuclease (patch repair protein)